MCDGSFKCIVYHSAQINDETETAVPDPQFDLESDYIAIAARTFGLCAAGVLILPDTLCEAGFVMM